MLALHRNRLFSLLETDKERNYEDDKILVPIKPLLHKQISFNEWKNIYAKQLEQILFVYESQIANMTSSDYNVFLNVHKFRELLIKKIYQTSSNRLSQSL